MSKQALAFENVSFSYEPQQKQTSSLVLDSLALSVNEGEFISLLGPSGSGKSTIFRLITGLEQPTAGTISLHNEVSSNRLGKVGYMPQQDLLLEWRTILENATLPLELKGTNKKEAKQLAKQHLQDFGLNGYENHYPQALSGGMRQRVSFLRAMLSGSNILLLDEPFSALDAMTRLTMQEWLLEQWEKTKKTIIFITHDVDEALLLSDRIFLFSARPISSYEEIHVPLKRPRTIEKMSEPTMVELKRELLQQLRKQVKL
ncbi:ABC transporter ATP-binding protein [Desertibacillus haloalkaliphilus]|uniref:ABC transporter ATP-binding protein n=1 Tax=Desertibacillus haloalkaliphilus TaxID=1328930 RepID=UPI001C27BAA3|nr:ABC transporter ATP-binding protein [Desertibacillus haloalkaliphilus]MBU8906775.1 ABC transporter ATP-binding protein [Desertibacillus haloalkaliphilus]